MYIPLKSFFECLEVDVVVPPACSKRTLELGIKYSPEFACLPLKINIGNYIEALEKGADTIIMAGGIGPCRFGYYAEVQREILKDAGYKFNMVVFDPPKGHLWELFKKLEMITNKKIYSYNNLIYAARLAWQKAKLLDELDMMACRARPREKFEGETDKFYKKSIKLIGDVMTLTGIKNIQKQIEIMFRDLILTNSDSPRIGLTGEIYTILEPFANLNIEKQLGEIGVEVHRSIYITDWVRHNLFPAFLKPREHKEFLDSSKPFINCFIGGHGQESIAYVAKCAKEGFNGIIQLLPFTCMPEIVAKSVLPSASRKYLMPAMTLVLDEHAAEAGLRTRIEAFVDMIKYKSEVQNENEMFIGH
ncbi:MAG: acyl-CoA dehydratase activase-related protein [Tepidanaerobacteraceae bacterium]|nr:acyl-CoA dehydratase activase-related protein [Tepidanaerobacteraceae bacterium]